ncbi:hypothetical protein [Streptomyces decoyicus]|uniref:hypothetical protein n=1 Tax=Streptomyces decoyicus TaxID=249567 RepID=UPI0033A4EA34
MRRLPRGFVDLRTIPGWALHRLAVDRIELRSPDGGSYSRITVPASSDVSDLPAPRHRRGTRAVEARRARPAAT